MSDNNKECGAPRVHPISNVPAMQPGNRPVDGGAYTFSAEEKEDFLAQEPQAARWFRPWIGGPELLRGRPRYYLYLQDATSEDLEALPESSERVKLVEEFRRSSRFPEIVKLGEKPLSLAEESIQQSPYLVVPTIVSERRTYVPVGMLEPEALAGITLHIVPDATLYELGVLASSAHAAWMQATADKEEGDYRYVPAKVYNTFPWPEPTPEQKKRIEETAQGILDARALYPDKSLAVLSDEKSMPPELRKAHEENDRAVMEAYGMDAQRATTDDLLDLLRIRFRELTAAE